MYLLILEKENEENNLKRQQSNSCHDRTTDRIEMSCIELILTLIDSLDEWARRFRIVHDRLLSYETINRRVCTNR
jgi:hypothetical protein